MSWETTSAGERLEFLARHFKVSMRKLSEGAGASPTHAEQLINQGQKGMQAKTALGYSRGWGVSIDWLTEGKGEPFTITLPGHIPDELQRVLDADPPKGRRGVVTPAILEQVMTSHRFTGARREETEWCGLIDDLLIVARKHDKKIEPPVVRDDPTEKKPMKRGKAVRG